MRDFIYIYFYFIKILQNYWKVKDIRLNLREDGNVLIQTLSVGSWVTLDSFDTLSEFISWVEHHENFPLKDK